ncbi:MAG: hypothetical protein OXD30_08270 [Bryobacterales bacterium]|nr:hypothetical protein [Bryobacterales bacterium]
MLCLEPLTDEDIQVILRDNHCVDDPERFLAKTAEAGLEDLLYNPQALGLLVRAVGRGNDWPASRREVFEHACRAMACETNSEHCSAGQGGLPEDSLIDCAGRLCALALLSDKDGYSLDSHVAPERFMPRDPCGLGESEGLRAAVSSKLFRAVEERCFSPVHRQVGEFLAARYLAKRIAGGLSQRRVLALMTGGDGLPVTSLRGLSSWLAAHSEAVRAELICKNPVDLGVYGDLSGFSGGDKRQVLESLLDQPTSLARAFHDARKFSALAVSENYSVIRTALLGEGRDPEHAIRVRFVLRLLCAGEPRPDLERVARGIVMDGSWSGDVRQAALAAFVRCRKGSPAGNRALEEILEEFLAEGISIGNSNLCAALLRELYPETVGPGRIWNYFPQLGRAGSTGEYLMFWRDDLVAQSHDDCIAELLDALAVSFPRFEAAIGELHLSAVPLAILQRGLRLHGERAGIERVSAWLATCATAARDCASNPPACLLDIRAWLEHHPEIQKEVILAGLEACQDGDNVGYADWKNRKKLLGARLPADFGQWCLKQAVRLAGAKPEAAAHLLGQAYGSLDTAGVDEGLSLQVLRASVRPHPELEGLLKQLEAPRPSPEHGEPQLQERSALDIEQERWREHLLTSIESHRTDLLENRAPPGLLYQLARVYCGKEGAVSPTGLYGKEAILRILREPSAADAALHGLCHSIERDDLPSAREIIRFAKQDTEPYIALPLLVALQERQESAPGFLADLEDGKLRMFVACLHCWCPLWDEDRNRAWYNALLASQPALVSGVAAQCAAGVFGGSRGISSWFWEIADGQQGETVAASAVLGLLRSLPTRCNAAQVNRLDELLWRGLRFGWQSDLLALLEKRLARRGTDAGQRARWLGLGLICNPGEYADLLAEEVRGREPWARHLARFFVHPCRGFDDSPDVWHSYLKDFEPTSLALIFCLLGKFFSPVKLSGYAGVSEDFHVSQFLHRVLHELGSRPSSGASESLDSLLDDPAVSDWHSVFSAARTAQYTLRRDAEYRYPTLQQTCAALRDGPPASACDLAALAMDRLERVARRIPASNSNEWRQYWNEGAYGRPSEPKVEEACRDALLAALRPLLPEHVSVEPEVSQVNRARADLEFASAGFKVPAEIKKNDHAELWSAIGKQLIPKYTLDPATGGYGIYLVFWCGAKCQRPRADGTKPATAKALQCRLHDSLTEEQARKIAVCVIDVCRPDPPAAAGVGAP